MSQHLYDRENDMGQERSLPTVLYMTIMRERERDREREEEEKEGGGGEGAGGSSRKGNRPFGF